MNFRIFLLTISIFFLSINTGFAQSISKPIRVLLVTGGEPIRYHKTLIPTSLYTTLRENQNIIWDHASLDEAAFENDIRELYDVLIIFNRSNSISDRAKSNLKNFIESGKGLVILHSGLGTYNNWEWWWKDVVGGKYQYNFNDTIPKSGYKKPVIFSLIPGTDHPVTNAVGKIEFEDELYNKLVFSPDIKTLYSSDHPESDGPLVWIGPHNKSRVITIVPGHFGSTYFDYSFRALFYNSIYWAAKKEFLIKPYNKEGSKIMQKDFDAIKNVIETAYIEGIHTTQDEKTIRSGFHPDFEMLVLKENEIQKVDLQKWLPRVEQLKNENKELWEKVTSYDMLEISVKGNAASLKFDVYKGEKFFSTDFMLLYKFNEGWKIVSKIFTF
ncbi:MAG: ThuA domain-containing protein [Ignavibacteria bacterium]|jgi:type 1 glutamine amidotransferase